LEIKIKERVEILWVITFLKVLGIFFCIERRKKEDERTTREKRD